MVFDRHRPVDMQCRLGCGACCIAPSISSPLPGMPYGKKAGERCVNLSEDNLCKIFGRSDRPQVCEAFKATEDVCGNSNQQAIEIISYLEKVTG